MALKELLGEMGGGSLDEILGLKPSKPIAIAPKKAGFDFVESPLYKIDTTAKEKPKLNIKDILLNLVSPTKSGLLDLVLRPEEFKESIETQRKLFAKKPSELSAEETAQLGEAAFTQAAGMVSPGMKKLPANIPIQAEALETGPIQTVMKALKEAKPLRGKQEALYSEERARRVAKVAAMGEKVKGQAGYYAQLGQLKGELPKVQFESIKDKIKQADVDALFQKVEDTGIFSPFEKVAAKTGLEKLVGAKGGAVPTRKELSLLNEVFPPEFIKTIQEKRPLMEKLWGGVGEILNLPRAVMATADLSSPLRQGIFLIGRPKQFIPAFKDMFKYAFSEKAYQGLAENIQARPTYKLMREAKLSLTDIGADMTQREEAFMSNLGERIPIFGRIARGSNRAYSGFLNKLRADTFDDLVKSGTKLGVIKERPEVINDIAKFVNSATGRGELGGLDRAAVALNGAFFSPRLMASRLNLLNPAYYIKLDPFVRKEALKSLFLTSSVIGTVLGLAKAGGAGVEMDSRSADFLKIKIGKTRIDVLGGFQQYLVAIARLISGQMVSSTTGKQFNLGEGYKPTTRADIIQRFFESKTSPVASFALELLRGKTSGGDGFDLPVSLANRFTPMVVGDMYDLYKEGGLQKMGLGIPAIFGTGVQTYGEQVPLESTTKTGKPNIKWAQTPGLSEDLINAIRGTKIEPVPAKGIYDQIQALKQQGKEEEAQNIADSMTDKDWELYKKFRQRDRKIAADEMKIKVVPIYRQIQDFIKQGKEDIAQGLIDQLTDDEYKAYKSIKESDYKKIQ